MHTPAPLHAALVSPDARHRVLALRDMAVARLGIAAGVAWLFRPSPYILDVVPGAAAWYGPGAAVAAAAALEAVGAESDADGPDAADRGGR